MTPATLDETSLDWLDVSDAMRAEIRAAVRRSLQGRGYTDPHGPARVVAIERTGIAMMSNAYHMTVRVEVELLPTDDEVRAWYASPAPLTRRPEPRPVVHTVDFVITYPNRRT